MSENRTRHLVMVDAASANATDTSDFQRSVAVVIGINDYRNGIPRLNTAVNDARRLAELLCHEHKYTVHLLAEEVTKTRLTDFLRTQLPGEIDQASRLLLYFAGHGIVLDSDDGPAGYLVPQDADTADIASFLPMTDLHAWLEALPCRHVLLILDCCFAGAIRWNNMRNLAIHPQQIYRERYQLFVRSSAWQAITSAAYDEKALDILKTGDIIGRRAVGIDTQHSPFALALFDALNGAGDTYPPGQNGQPAGDGLLTANELSQYLRDQVALKAQQVASHRQTPGLWPLKKHQAGEYVFQMPGRTLNLKPALPPAPENNPYRGLKSYDEQDESLFFGRTQLIAQLAQQVAAQPLMLVLGASGTGKSSLVKAGLLPYLRRQADEPSSVRAWRILPPMRPGDQPLSTLVKLLCDELATGSTAVTGAQAEGGLDHADGDQTALLRQSIAHWRDQQPEQRLLLVVDQFEELITLCREEAVRQTFLAQLADLVHTCPADLRLVITLRTDFEPQFADSALFKQQVTSARRFIVPPLSQAELREIIEKPAMLRVLYFDPPALIDRLIDEVVQTPGALPLLSFTLEQLYVKYVARYGAARNLGQTIDRAFTMADYDALGGVIGSLRTRADEEYNQLPDDAHRATMQRVMLRMVAVEGGEVARRRVMEVELTYPNDEENIRVKAVIARLVDARLVVSDRLDIDGDAISDTYIEPAHDALVGAWDRLRTWQVAAEHELPLSLQRTLTQAAHEWRRARPDDQIGLLWNNNPWLSQLTAEILPAIEGRADTLAYWLDPGLLFRAERQVRSKPTRFNQQEMEFIVRSAERRTFLWRRLIGITLAVMVALVSIAAFAELQRRSAVENEKLALQREAQAKREETIARANLLTTLGNTAFEALPLTGLRLAIEGLATIPRDHASLPQIESVVRQLLSQGRLQKLGQNDLRQLYPSPSGRVLVLDHDSDAVPDELLRLDMTASITITGGPISAVSYDPTEAYVSVTYFWPDENEPRTRQELRRTDNGARLLQADDHYFGDDASIARAFTPSPTWAYFVVETDFGEAKIIRRPDLSIVASLPEWLNISAFHPQADQLRVAYRDDNTGDEVAVLYALATDQRTRLPPTAGTEFSPDGRYLIATPAASAAALYDLQAQQFVSLSANAGQVTALQFITQTAYFTVAFEDGHVELYNAVTAQPYPLSAGLGATRKIEFSPQRAYFVVTYQLSERYGDQTIELRRTATGAIVDLPTDAAGNSIDHIEFSPQESFWQVSYPTGEMKILRSDTAEPIYTPIEFFVHFSPDDSHFVDSSDEGYLWIMRVDTLQQVAVNGVLRQVKFSPKGSFYRTWDEGYQTQFVRSIDDQLLPTGNFTTVVYSPNEAYFVTTYATGSSKLWDGKQGMILAELGQRIKYLQFDTVLNRLLIVYEDGSGYMLDLAWLTALKKTPAALSVDELIQFACAQLRGRTIDTSLLATFGTDDMLQACR